MNKSRVACSRFLFQAGVTDPFTFLTISVLFVIVALVATCGQQLFVYRYVLSWLNDPLQVPAALAVYATAKLVLEQLH